MQTQKPEAKNCSKVATIILNWNGMLKRDE
jgi:hypothetical protein